MTHMIQPSPVGEGERIHALDRRLLVLLAIGALHGLFVWTGDVLLGYALCGMVLLLFRAA
jgi:uncharacterized protein